MQKKYSIEKVIINSNLTNIEFDNAYSGYTIYSARRIKYFQLENICDGRKLPVAQLCAVCRDWLNIGCNKMVMGWACDAVISWLYGMAVGG